ncbi:polyamine transport protein [Nadsonia fulvescens var. elongata DSM 6958]|uniref:Polyamine transport protein n=1 Tax=Nadsonia fulvescens var. elongata DSM 6958 TaxID=857566 RepID=A0A1E3PJD3_9ASCO|nr:polyamine transport protein [Nadsonia fulvescens var. elongata DSM 6958]
MAWDSDSDRGNPKNWPTWKKWVVTMIVAWICLVVSFGSSLYVTGVPYIVAKFHVSQTLAFSGLTFYLLGLAAGPMVAAPISELMGRKVIYITTLPISMLFVMAVGLAKNIETILVCRFFAGFFASPPMAVAGGTITDIWELEEMGVAMSAFCLAPFAGPVLGPIIGGFASMNKHTWKWTAWIQLMFSGAILPLVFAMPETYRPIIMKKRAKTRNLPLKKSEIGLGKFLSTVLYITLLRPLRMLFLEPIVSVLSIYVAFIFAVLFGFFEAYPVIFEGVYHFSLGITGLAFLGIGVGLVCATTTYIVIDRVMFFPKNADGTRGTRDANGKLILAAPETKLLPAKIGALLLPGSLFWIGWSSKVSVHWIVPILAGVPFGASLLLIFYTVLTYISTSYPPMVTASALAANNLARYILASVFPLFTIQMYKKLHITWASTLFAFVAVALMPVPWMLERWGATLRARSIYNVQETPTADTSSEDV